MYPGLSFTEGHPQTRFQFVEVRTKLGSKFHVHPTVVLIDRNSEEHLIPKAPLLAELAVFIAENGATGLVKPPRRSPDSQSSRLMEYVQVFELSMWGKSNGQR